MRGIFFLNEEQDKIPQTTNSTHNDSDEREGDVHTEEANQVMVLLGKHLIGIHKGRFERCVDPRLSCHRRAGNVCTRGRCRVDKFSGLARSGTF